MSKFSYVPFLHNQSCVALGLSCVHMQEATLFARKFFVLLINDIFQYICLCWSFGTSPPLHLLKRKNYGTLQLVGREEEQKQSSEHASVDTYASHSMGHHDSINRLPRSLIAHLGGLSGSPKTVRFWNRASLSNLPL